MLISRNLHIKSSEVLIKTRSTAASLSFKGQATKPTTVKIMVYRPLPNCVRTNEQRRGREDLFALSFAQTKKIQSCPVNLKIVLLLLQNLNVAYCNGNINYQYHTGGNI